MGNECAKTNPQTDLLDMREEKKRREYYLNMNNNGVGISNYDITENRRVGYGHIQKTNLFH